VGLPIPGPACLLALHDLGRSLLSTAHTLVLGATVLARLKPGWPATDRPAFLSAFLGLTALKSATVLAHAFLTAGDTPMTVTSSPPPPPLLLTGLEAVETVCHVVLLAALIGYFIAKRAAIVQHDLPGPTRFVFQTGVVRILKDASCSLIASFCNLFPYVSRSRIEEVGNGNPLEMMNASLLGLCQAG
jgi:hypothetical protein